MTKKKIRTYYSLARQRQADETRNRIAAAGRKLILENGYAAATMEAIAREAGVATPTVYAVFSSKRRILTELIDRAAFGPAYQELVAQAYEMSDPVPRLRQAARIARQIYQGQSSEFELLRAAGVVTAELVAMEDERENGRYEAQGPSVALLVKSGRMLPPLTESQARDILWTLTSHNFYRMLVMVRGWTPDQYEAWLADTVVASLVAPAA
jgi:AcrR family transcriptional regulator